MKRSHKQAHHLPRKRCRALSARVLQQFQQALLLEQVMLQHIIEGQLLAAIDTDAPLSATKELWREYREPKELEMQQHCAAVLRQRVLAHGLSLAAKAATSTPTADQNTGKDTEQ